MKKTIILLLLLMSYFDGQSQIVHSSADYKKLLEHPEEITEINFWLTPYERDHFDFESIDFKVFPKLYNIEIDVHSNHPNVTSIEDSLAEYILLKKIGENKNITELSFNTPFKHDFSTIDHIYMLSISNHHPYLNDAYLSFDSIRILNIAYEINKAYEDEYEIPTNSPIFHLKNVESVNIFTRLDQQSSKDFPLSSLANLTTLREIFIEDTEGKIEIPNSWNKLKELRDIKIHCTVAEIPECICELPYFYRLDISGSEIFPSIPNNCLLNKEFLDLHVYISSNLSSGPSPKESRKLNQYYKEKIRNIPVDNYEYNGKVWYKDQSFRIQYLNESDLEKVIKRNYGSRY
ncbi:MAG: hypothetical protein PHQ74_01930 [Crocinitomicaceae bacterium]|nr:hypothetical protein [Crocinitomicaceae bacterium]